MKKIKVQKIDLISYGTKEYQKSNLPYVDFKGLGEKFTILRGINNIGSEKRIEMLVNWSDLPLSRTYSNILSAREFWGLFNKGVIKLNHSKTEVDNIGIRYWEFVSDSGTYVLTVFNK